MKPEQAAILCREREAIRTVGASEAHVSASVVTRRIVGDISADLVPKVPGGYSRRAAPSVANRGSSAVRPRLIAERVARLTPSFVQALMVAWPTKGFDRVRATR